MRTLALRLPWPPTVNHYYGRTRIGRVYLKKAGRLYRREAAAEFARLGWPRLEGPVGVHMILSPPDRRKRDIDNINKAIYDALSDRRHKGVVIHRGVIPDDANIKKSSSEFAEAGEGLVEIVIHELKGTRYEEKTQTRR
jgi:crossover junction endodeoxyribonuclease RusA